MNILGIDFSGAAQAGQKIWVAHATAHATQQDGVLQLHDLQRGAALPGSGAAREVALPALVNWISGFAVPRCGFDFPLSLAEINISGAWREWLLREALPCPDAETFRERFADAPRRCDRAAKTPFSPLNLRLYRQTFHGLRDVIAPLLQNGACALPFEEARPDAAWLLEVCPASLLKREKLYLSYKGKSAAQRANREIIWGEIAERHHLVADEALREAALGDTEGDALDAVLAAVAVQRALGQPQSLAARNDSERSEGRVYF